MGKSGFECLFEASGGSQQLEELVAKALELQPKSLMILAADGSRYTAEAVSPIIGGLSIPVFGGVFPEVVYNQGHYDEGLMVVAFQQNCSILTIDGLSDTDADYLEQIEPFLEGLGDIRSAVIVADGLSARVAALLQDVYELLGSGVRIIGGGAGSLSFEQKPCLFSNQGLLVDSAQIVCFPPLQSVAIDHGWQPFSGPYMVTASDKTRVEAIDFQPAFAVYRNTVEADAKQEFNNDNFFDIAQAYPIGMTRFGGRYVVRDPLFVDDGTLVCVGEVPSNQEVYLLKGEQSHLLAAAEQCGQAIASAGEPSFALLFDCISRRLFMQQEFEQELGAIKRSFDEGIPVIGVLCLGEIAGNGDTALEFYNKTVVVGGVVCDD